jgi:hypothetical protein
VVGDEEVDGVACDAEGVPPLPEADAETLFEAEERAAWALVGCPQLYITERGEERRMNDGEERV